MDWKNTLYATLLFVLLTPKFLFTFPRKGSKWTIATIHAAIFAILLYFTSAPFLSMFSIYEGNYTPNSETDNPLGPPTVNSCNYSTLGKHDISGQTCFKDETNKLYYFDNTCSSESDKGKLNRNGAVCSEQQDEKKKSVYNFISK